MTNLCNAFANIFSIIQHAGNSIGKIHWQWNRNPKKHGKTVNRGDHRSPRQINCNKRGSSIKMSGHCHREEKPVMYFAVIITLVISLCPVLLFGAINETRQPCRACGLHRLRSRAVARRRREEGRQSRLVHGACRRILQRSRPRFRGKIWRAGGILSRCEQRLDRQSAGRVAGKKIFDGRGGKLSAVAHADARDETAHAIHVPHLAKFSADAKEDAGKGTVFWATDRESYMGFAYNKDKLPDERSAKKLRRSIESRAEGQHWPLSRRTRVRAQWARCCASKGEEFLKRLRGQEITMHSVSGQALNDMIISGEVEASPTIFRNHALVAAEKKAPVVWVPMDIVPASAGSAGFRPMRRIRTPLFCSLIFCLAPKAKRF